jgi:cell division protein ZipA
MDKELLRVVIIAFGLIIIVGMLAWHFFRNKKSFQDMMFFGNQELKGKIDESIVVHGDNDEFDIVPKGRKKLIDTDELIEKIKARSRPKAKAPEPEPEAEAEEPVESMFGDFDGEFDFADEGPFAKEAEPPAEPPLARTELLDADELFGEPDKDPEAPRFVAPDIIQFRVMARAAEGFNGLDMLKAFRIAQLEYGSLKIFERYDANNLVDFGVACMVEGGTFPDHDVDQFYCPGLVFFMQPALLDEAVRVFDDYLEAINIVAVELDGDLLDHEKNPLTNATIKMIRQSL